MDFLKKHYEKLTLAAALILLIVSAILLSMKVSALSTALEEAPRRAPNPNSPAHWPQTYSDADAGVADPPIWRTDITARVFSQQAYVEPKAIPDPGKGLTNNGLPILLAVVHKPFTLLFKTYSYDADRQRYNFQLNFQFRSHSFFVRAVGDPIKDRYEDTGYKVVKFEKKTRTIDDPATQTKRDLDVSELTVQHPGNNPALILGQAGVEEEPVAQFGVMIT